jgi:hypothetical protein
MNEPSFQRMGDLSLPLSQHQLMGKWVIICKAQCLVTMTRADLKEL